MPHPGPNGGPAVIDPLDVIKTTVTVAGFFGAVLVGVYGYRKQRLIEGDAHRADAEQLAQRYTTAAGQLGHEKAAVRLAGIYAMAQLADDWAEQRQVCIDVLCAYLRMPYEIDAVSGNRSGEREVRRTIIGIVRDHLRDPDSPTTWCGRDLDFTDATFDGGDFAYTKLTGEVCVEGAKFTGGNVFFGGAEFAGGEVSYEGAEFGSEGTVSFDDAKFAGGAVSFVNAKFTGGGVSFHDAEFIGSKVYFAGAEFIGGTVSLGGAEFSGGKVYFSGAKFVGGEVSFLDAKFTGGEVPFYNAEFSGSRITRGPFEPPAAWTALQNKER